MQFGRAGEVGRWGAGSISSPGSRHLKARRAQTTKVLTSENLIREGQRAEMEEHCSKKGKVLACCLRMSVDASKVRVEEGKKNLKRKQ